MEEERSTNYPVNYKKDVVFDDLSIYSKAQSIKYDRLHGIKNAALLLLGMMVFRNILREFSLSFKFPDITKLFTVYDLSFGLLIFILILLVSALVYRCRNNFISYCILLFSELIISLLIYKLNINQITSTILYIYSILYVFKLFSYINLSRHKNLYSFIQFLIFPVLVYKEAYTMKSKRNYAKLFHLLFQLPFLCILFFYLSYNYGIPSLMYLSNASSLLEILSCYLNFAMWCATLFILFFLIYFYCCCQILAEITLFDEHVYLDWWNVESSEEFWRRWNIPVHDFIKKHLYIPFRKCKINRNISSLLCFTFSGIVHQYIVSMAIHKFNMWFFIGMVSQAPLHFITDYVKVNYKKASNLVFWILFIFIGQPILVYLMFGQFCKEIK